MNLKHLKIFTSRANDPERAPYTAEIHNISEIVLSAPNLLNIIILNLKKGEL